MMEINWTPVLLSFLAILRAAVFPGRIGRTILANETLKKIVVPLSAVIFLIVFIWLLGIVAAPPV